MIQGIHPLSVQVGTGLVPYCPEPCFSQTSGRAYGPGWVLPGGERTTDQFRAQCVARSIDKFINPQAYGSAPITTN